MEELQDKNLNINNKNIISIFFIRHAHVDYANFEYKGKDINLSPNG
jgi:hypothetical protein